mgnify:CR=1 FL=1
MADNYSITLGSPEERINPFHPAWNKYGGYFNLNDFALDFTLEGVVNNQNSKVALSNYKGKWVILFFYSSNFSFVWPTELAAVAEQHDKFINLNSEVLAISTDSILSHKMFIQTSPSANKINYPLLSDRNFEISKKYGVFDENGGYAYRATFVIDTEGEIKSYLVYPDSVGRNIDELLRLLEGLQYNQKTSLGVQSGWKPGDSGIEVGWDHIGKY